MKTVAIYARVSTSDQNPRMQLKELRSYARRRRLRVAHELVDQESGANMKRPQLDKLMDLARKRKLDIVLVWKFDRFARSTKHLVTALEEFIELGVDFVSYTENVDTSTPAGKALFTMVSAFAEFERDLIRERVKAGLDRARADGTVLGRPAVDAELVVKLRHLRCEGKSMRTIAKETGLSVGVVSKYLKSSAIDPPGTPTQV
jgi:DNA invertase Pin-like site-specific DNA recombinase